MTSFNPPPLPYETVVMLTCCFKNQYYNCLSVEVKLINNMSIELKNLEARTAIGSKNLQKYC